MVYLSFIPWNLGELGRNNFPKRRFKFVFRDGHYYVFDGQHTIVARKHMKPNYVSCGFPKLLEEHGLRRVRYHDLRHSCASLLLANGVPMKQIQEWLGHSDFSTTANIYAHLEYSSKVISADAMLAGLGIGNQE